MRQLDLLAPPSAIDEAFHRFNKANPGVLDELIAMTARAKAGGHGRISMKMLFEVIRYNHMLETHGDDFYLNNSFTSRYVRVLSDQRPDLAGMFEGPEAALMTMPALEAIDGAVQARRPVVPGVHVPVRLRKRVLLSKVGDAS